MAPAAARQTVSGRNGSASRILGTVALLVAVAAILLVWPIQRDLARVLRWIQAFGPRGALVYAALYVPAAVLFVPGAVLTVGAGFLFGLGLGTVVVSAGSTAGAASAFLVGRTLARKWVSARIARNAKFEAIDRAIGTEGFKIVLLTRLSPAIPFNLLNYAFGLTTVPFGTYVLASWIGMLPATIMYVYLGSVAKSLTEVLSSAAPPSLGRWVLLAVGLAATIAVTVVITRIARRALSKVLS